MGDAVTEPYVGTFANHAQFERARAALESLSLSYRLISPEPGFGRVGVPSLVLDEDTHRALHARFADAFTCAGWVKYRPATGSFRSASQSLQGIFPICGRRCWKYAAAWA